jgi:hypothetical protein
VRMLVRGLMSLCVALAPSVAVSGSVLSCTVESVCTARGCEMPPRSIAFGLRITDAATLILSETDSSETVNLPVHAGPVPDRMQVFSGLDGNGLVILSLRHDGAVTLSLHAGRMVGAFANDSTLSMGRCEVSA